MTSETEYSAPVYFGKEEEFVQVCADLRSGNRDKLNAATAQLNSFPPAQTQALLLTLWQQEEPARRGRMVRHSARVHALLRGYLILLLLVGVILLVSWLQGITPPWQVFIFVLYLGIMLLGLIQHHSKPLASPLQLRAFDILRRQRVPCLTRLWVDALDFRIGDSSSLGSSNPYRSVIYPVLADLLPQYANRDTEPLDAYQQQILRQEISRLTRHLHKQTRVLDDTETQFVAAAIQYLATQTRQGTPSATASLVQELALLPQIKNESVNRRLVRDVAAEYLPVIQVGKS